jgi:epsilon-lactone hydrolase
MPSDELHALVARMRANPSVADVAAMRARMQTLVGASALPAEVEVTAVDAGGVACDWVLPSGVRRPRTILFFHGGGYVLGSAQTHRHLAFEIAAAADAEVLVVDYRLAPEHPFPAAADDAMTAYKWLLGQGIPPAQIAIVGDSAGGGLALATVLSAAKAGLPRASCLLAICPWTDLSNSGASIAANRLNDPSVTEASLNWLAALYLEGHDRLDSRASPLFGALQGLPPTLIQVGSVEILLDDSLRFSERARKAGVDIECQVWDGMPHVWPLYSSALPEGRDAVAKAGAFLLKHIAG